MLKVAHYKKIAPQVNRILAEIPERITSGEKSALREYAVKYARTFFGVSSEYSRMDQIRGRLARQITNFFYSGALEMNPGWFVMHLSKVPINTWPELGKGGMKYIAKGYAGMLTEEGREFVARSGVLMDKLWTFPSMGFELKKEPRGWLRLTTSLSDMADRTVSYLAAFEKAKDLGFLGDPNHVGKITWERVNQLAAEGIDVEKAFAYADGVMARSEFFYTPAHVQMWQREHPVLGMFKHYLFREADFISSIYKIAKEVKAQKDPESYIKQKVSEGHYEYIDAVAKYHRLLISLTSAALVSALGGGTVLSKFWPLHIPYLLSPPVSFATDTLKLMSKTLHGDATEKEWERWATDFLRNVPYVGGVLGTYKAFSKEEKDEEKKKKHHFVPMEKPKFDNLSQ
jgi:hypothetical protein